MPACRRQTVDQQGGGQPSPPPPAPASALRVERAGLSIAFELRPHDGAPLAAGAEAEAVFTIRDATTGAPVRNLRPFAWMWRRRGAAAPDEAACKAQIKTYLGGALAAQAEVDMNGYLLWSLSDEKSIAIINPQTSFRKTKLQRVIELPGKPFQAVLGPEGRGVYVSVPDTDEVIVIDAERHRITTQIPVGDRPSRIAISPDGRHVWVSNDGDGTVSVIDARDNRMLKTISAGEGSLSFAFTDGGRKAWVASRAGKSVAVIDAASLEVETKIEIGEGATAIDASDKARAVMVGRGARGEVVIIDAERRQISARLALGPSLGALRFAPDGRFAFALGRASGEVSIIDAATSRVAHELRGLAAPDALTFTDAYAYVRHGDEGKVSLIELGALTRESPPALIDITVGQTAPSSAGGIVEGSPMVPMPEGRGAIIANPADKMFYVYTEGMMAPIGSLPSYGQVPRSLLFVDRTLREKEPGVYSTSVRVERSGTHDLALLIDDPRVSVCLEQRILPSGGEALDPGERMQFEPLFDARQHLEAGKPASLRFRVRDVGSPEPLRDVDIEALVFRDPVGFSARPAPRAVEDGDVYEVTFTPPSPGRYRFLLGVPSRGVKLGAIPTLSLGVEEAGVARTAGARTSKAGGPR